MAEVTREELEDRLRAVRDGLRRVEGTVAEDEMAEIDLEEEFHRLEAEEWDVCLEMNKRGWM